MSRLFLYGCQVPTMPNCQYCFFTPSKRCPLQKVSINLIGVFFNPFFLFNLLIYQIAVATFFASQEVEKESLTLELPGEEKETEVAENQHRVTDSI